MVDRLGFKTSLTKPPGAFAFLQDDGTAEPGLRDVNEGLGQTHRGKLQVCLITQCSLFLADQEVLGE